MMIMADSGVEMMDAGKDKRKRRKGGNDSRNQGRGKAQSYDESSPVVKLFITYRDELDTKHDKYERLVKISRDITIESKRVIFLLHRICGNDSKEQEILDEAQQKLQEVRDLKFKLIAKELENDDPYRFTRAYSPGLQEYIEAVSFYNYWKSGELVTLESVQKDLVYTVPVEEKSDEPNKSEKTISVHVPPIDFVLGLADLTGELMRYAINSVGNGDFETPFSICNFLRSMYDAFVSFGNIAREVKRKLQTLEQSLKKVEKACYTLKVRGSEFPDHMLKDMLANHLADDFGGEQPTYDD